MHPMFRATGRIALLGLASCQAEPRDEVALLTQAQAPYEEPGEVGNPPQDPCRENQVCNWYACGEDDPDCEAPELEEGGQDEDEDDGFAPFDANPSLVLGRWDFEGEVYQTPISGVESDDVFTLGSPSSDDRAVYGILLRERSDEPCHVALGIEELTDQTSDDVPVLNLCGGNQPTSSTLAGDYLDVNAGGADDHEFLSGVSVCMNRDDDKVKGLSVVGKRLEGDGTITALSSEADPPHRPNCHAWMEFVECPHQQIATAVELHFRDGTRQSLTGISLHCRTPVWQANVAVWH